MLNINNITIRNFLSIGNVSQGVNFDNEDLVLVLGENLDLGGNDNRNGVGKAQPLYSKIKTPGGWTTMGDIKVGDIVSTPDGKTAAVTRLFPQGKKPTYRFTFSDGRSTDACEDHLWKVFSHNFNLVSDVDNYRVLTTLELIEHREKHKDYKNKSTYYQYVPLLSGDGNPAIELPLDPYFVGAMLGDGYMKDVSFTSADDEVIENISNCLPSDTIIKKSLHDTYGYNITNKTRVKERTVRKRFRELNILECVSNTKFIPQIYKSASVDQRISLLQGLVDTDGYVGAQGCISITTVSFQLANDVVDVVRSIGGLATIATKDNCGYKKDGKFIKCQEAYSISIMYHTPKLLSRLARKRDRLPRVDYQYKNRKLRIDSIEYIGDIESKCILIDHPEHLYITDDYVVTHNSAIVNALSYALFGTALTRIKQDNLINKTNGKNMLVTLEFEKDGNKFRIERGRKPKVFRFLVNGKDVDGDEETDEAQGDSRVSQKEIERHIGLSHNMFKNIVTLNTYNEPFLAMGGNDQRDIIEQLLGITKLSEKAEKLKVLLKVTRDEIKEEEFRIKAIQEANKQIEESIRTTKAKSTSWQKKHERTIQETTEAIVVLNELDVDLEIANHRILEDIEKNESKKRAYERELNAYEREYKRTEKEYKLVKAKLDNVEENSCPTCNQAIDVELHTHLETELTSKYEELEDLLDEKSAAVTDVSNKIAELDIPAKPKVFYSTLDEAYGHKSTTASLEQALLTEKQAVNPFVDQLGMLDDTLKEVSYDQINAIVSTRDHQEFVLKLLTNKDSFIRKKIIDQNLTYLNKRLAYYLDKIGLPHSVRFLSNLEVEITEHGRDLDFDNLSRGERTRLILSLSWAFRDVYESLNDKINLLFIDELIDSGLDTSGVESALSALKEMNRENGRNIFLISHRDELVGRVDSILRVVKEGGFTNFETTEEN